MLNVVKVDSLKIRIPEHKVSYIDPNFASEFVKYYPDTKEVDPEINLENHKVNITKGIKTRIAKLHILQGSKTEVQIVIQCNAKKLKSKYLEGINNLNIKIVYDYIIQLNIVYFTFKDFLEGYVSDIDICYDVSVDPISMAEANTEIYKNVLPSMYKYVGKPFNQKGNVGLQFNIRDKATPAKPFCKIYHKTLELKTQSLEFYVTYLNGINCENRGRLEFCIKNTKHKEYLKLDFKSLNELLTLSQDQLEQIIFSGILKYIEKTTIIREYRDLSPTQRLMLTFVNRLIKKGSDKEEIYSALNEFDHPNERSRMKKYLLKLLENVDDKKRVFANKKTLDFLRQLKLDFEKQNPEL